MAPRSAGYTQEEDVLLCSIYANISQDNIIGKSQSLERFWIRVTEDFNREYNKDRDDNQTERTVRSIQSRFTLIQKDCKVFLNCINTVEAFKRSGASEIDTLKEARDLFKNDPNGNRKGFKYDHVFDIVKNLEKFKDHNEPRHPNKISRKAHSTHVSSSSDNPTPESPGLSSFSINLSDDNIGDSSLDLHDNAGGSSHERPPGVKKSKLKRKNQDKYDADAAEMKEHNSQIRKMLRKSSADRQKVFELEQQKLEIKQARHEHKILSVDLTSISDPVALLYYQQEREKIMQRRMGSMQQPPPQSSSGTFAQYFDNIGEDGSDLPPF